MSRVVAIVGGLTTILALVVGIVWLGRTRGTKPSPDTKPDAARTAPPPQAQDLDRERRASGASLREETRNEGRWKLDGRVRSSAGQAIAGATVTLALPSAEDAESEPVWRDSDWGGLRRPTVEVLTGSAGEFSLADLPEERPRGAVLWASHPDHAAASLVLATDRGTWPSPLEIVLEPRPGPLVLVLDSRGAPVAGALVEHHGLAGLLQDSTATGIGPERAQRLFHRSYTTGADGTVAAVALAGKQAFEARRGDELSAPWVGSAQPRLTLRLLPTFQVGGTLSLPDLPADPAQERRIVISAQTRNLWRDLGSLRGVERGAWGPVTVPLIEADRYRIRLEGAPIVPVEVFFPPPTPGARMSEDLSAEIGVELWFKVVDERGTVIPSAHVTARWQDPANPDHWHSASASKTREDQIGILSVPRGAFEADAFAPGYVPDTFGPEDTSVCDTAHVRMQLQRAGTLRGHVRYRGEPVEDFEVLVWRSNDRSSRRSATFLGRQDGSFELDTVPLGEFWVSASSSSTPACEPVAVTGDSSGATEVSLELLDGLRGRGRIVAHGTGEPLAQGSVQLFVRGDSGPIARWGLPLSVAADGSFDVTGFLPGENRLRALAPGFSNQVVTKEGASGSTLEWGDIVLTRTQELRHLVEPAERARGARAMGVGASTLPWRDFDEEGAAIYPEASSGSYAFAIVESDGTSTTFEAQLVSGEEWIFLTRLGGPNQLSVRALADGRDAMSRIDFVRASYLTSEGLRITRTRVVEGGAPVVFEGIEAPEVTVQLFLDQEPIATGGGAFREGRLDLVVPLDGRSFLVRVVDPAGEPVPDTRVTVDVPSFPGLFLAGGTDSHGECWLKGVPRGDIRVSLMHGSRGVRLGIPVDASTDSAELELEGGARLELAFEDRGTALGGVACTLLDEQGWSLVSAYQADQLGRLTVANLDPGEYRLKAARPDCWTVDVEARATPQGSVQIVRLRRLGDLELDVRTASGVAVTGVSVQLVALEFEEPVAEWIRAQRIPPVELRTDSAGKLRIARLPSGPYRWRIELAEGELVEGTLEVLPAQGTTSRILLPR